MEKQEFNNAGNGEAEDVSMEKKEKQDKIKLSQESIEEINPNYGKDTKTSITARLMKIAEEAGEDNLLTGLYLANSVDFTKMLKGNPEELLKRILSEQALEYKILSSLYTRFLATDMANCVVKMPHIIHDKIKIDTFLHKTMGVIKNLETPQGQMKISGKNVHVAYAQQFCGNPEKPEPDEKIKDIQEELIKKANENFNEEERSPFDL